MIIKEGNKLKLNDLLVEDNSWILMHTEVHKKVSDIEVEMITQPYNQGYLVLNVGTAVVVLQHNLLSEEELSININKTLWLPINTDIHVTLDDVCYTMLIDADTTIENCIALHDSIYSKGYASLNDFYTNGDITMEYIGVSESFEFCFSHMHGTFARFTKIKKTNLELITHSIEVSMEPNYRDNKYKPYFATVWEFGVDSERCNAYSTWGTTPEEAFIEASDFYNTYKKGDTL